MAKIVINSVSELKALQGKLAALKSVYPLLQEGAVKQTSEEILDEIHMKMNQNNFSDKIVDATFVGKIQKFGNLFRIHFISNYVADNGFDVSSGREEGTTHTKRILPKKKGGVLRWIGGAGKAIFRKWSKPKGIERLLIIENTIKENQDAANSRVEELMTEKIRKVLGV